MGLIDAITAVPDLRCLDDCDEWCVGLPLERVRVLDDFEVGALKIEALSQYRRQRWYAVSIAGCFALIYFSTVLFSSPPLFWLNAIAGISVTLFILWLATNPRSWIKRYRALQADIVSGVVHSFHHESCAGPLEVLPHAEVVYKSNEFSPRKWCFAPIASTAKIPAISSIASDWLQPVDGTSGRFFAGKRELSSAERAEIERCVDMIWSSQKRHFFSYLLWAFFVIWLWRLGSQDLFLSAVMVTAYSIMRVSPGVLRAIALRKDVVGGHVIINRRAAVQDNALVPMGIAAEFLPQTQVKWTEGGRPAEWRKTV